MNKYRAYDKLEKQMRRVVSLHWQNDTLVAVKVEGEAEPLPIEGRFIVEQYTGLKDKNGVEIAVGDVVRARGYSGYDNYSIVYSEHHASFNMRRADTPKWMRISDTIGRPHTGDMEVIGNIHENGELLEKGA